MAKQIFRKVALQRLASPEQLDQLMQITSPTGWLALLGTGLFLVIVVAWSFLGSIPTKVTGRGILVKSGGIYSVVAPDSGIVSGCYAGAGDVVMAGQVIARIEKPLLRQEISNQRDLIEDLQNESEMISRFGHSAIALQSESSRQQVAIVTRAIASLEQKKTWLKEKLANQQLLYKKGLLTQEQVVDTRQTLADTRQAIMDNRNKLKKLTLQKLQLTEEKKKQLVGIQNQLQDARRKLQALRKKLDEGSKVISPRSGRVLDVEIDMGSLVEPGSTIMRLERTGKNIEKLSVMMYFPAGAGKVIKVGMPALIAPSTVTPQEYGMMRGLVTKVSEFPVTESNLNKTLHNRTMVQSLLRSGAPIAVEIVPILDPRTPSGYKWSSSQGPPTTIDTGTDCFANVLVKEQRPISLVIPWCRKYLLGQ
jgi:HlyD family secretion protein